jgi:cytochrome P450
MQRPHGPRQLFAAPALPSRPEEIAPVYEWFREMREERPVALDERTAMPFWHVFGYDDVSTVLTDHARFSSRTFMFGDSLLSDTLVAKDPPDHRKLRNLVNLAFTPRAVARLSDRVAAITRELLDRVRARGEMDLVADLAFPLPARVIAELLGVPDEDWDIFQRWAALDGANPVGGPLDGARAEMVTYFSGLLEERRRSPREDLITALSTAEIDGERLSERDLVSFCVLLLFAGQETTKNLIANFVLTMSGRQGALAELRRDPGLVPSAVEEILRYLPPVWFLMRRTTADVELSGVRIAAGQMVLAWMASANRDASQFPEPDRFDVRRDPNRHLTFGHGVHFCVGAPLTRLEAKVAVPMMLEGLPDLRVVEGAPVAIRAGIVFVVGNLPVTFEPS